MWTRKVMQVFLMLVVLVFNVGQCFWITESPNNLNQTNAVKVSNIDLLEEPRKRKKKSNYLKELILGALLVKMIIFPLVVKAMAVMSTISVLLSTMSLIMSSIIGYIRVSSRRHESAVKVVHVNDVWAKGDDTAKDYILTDSLDYSPNVPLEQVHYNIRR